MPAWIGAGAALFGALGTFMNSNSGGNSYAGPSLEFQEEQLDFQKDSFEKQLAIAVDQINREQRRWDRTEAFNIYNLAKLRGAYDRSVQAYEDRRGYYKGVAKDPTSYAPWGPFRRQAGQQYEIAKKGLTDALMRTGRTGGSQLQRGLEKLQGQKAGTLAETLSQIAKMAEEKAVNAQTPQWQSTQMPYSPPPGYGVMTQAPGGYPGVTSNTQGYQPDLGGLGQMLYWGMQNNNQSSMGGNPWTIGTNAPDAYDYL